MGAAGRLGPASRLTDPGGPVNLKVVEEPLIVALYLASIVFELGGNLGKMFFKPNSNHP